MSIKVMTAVWDYGPTDSTQRFILLAIADNARDDGSHTWPSIKELAGKCALSERTVVRAVDALIAGGYLLRQRRQNTSNLYQIVLDRLRPDLVSDNLTLPESASEPVSDKMTPPPANPVSDNLTLSEVTDCHPRKCQDVTHVGDTVSPDPSLIHHSNHQDDPSTASPPTPATATVPAVAAAADYRAAILDWIQFDDALTPKEHADLDVATLLAWAYWVKLKQAERESRVYNPVGLVRAQWRNDKHPRADLLRLARGWLFLDDDGRARLLGRLEWCIDFGGQDTVALLEDDFPDIPARAAGSVYTATYGELAPPALSPAEPVRPTDHPTPAAQRAASPSRSTPQTPAASEVSKLWRDTLTELEMQMTRATYNSWLAGTTADLNGDELVVHVRNHYAVDWLSGRLHDLITRTVTGVAGRPIIVRYEAADALQEAQP